MKVFTTGQVAEICEVASRTVAKWFDSGRLKGYRVPGSRDRRIPRQYLIEFLKEHKVPLGNLATAGICKVLFIRDEMEVSGLNAHIVQILKAHEDFMVITAANSFEAGMQMMDFRPDCIIIDFAMGETAAQLCRSIRKNPDLKALLIALVPSQQTVDSQGIKEIFKKPFDPTLLIRRLVRLMDLN